LGEFEAGDAPLATAKQNRSRVEYYFTCTPSLPLFLLERFPEIDAITYLDADLYFFSSPEPVFAEIGDRAIAIVPHRFGPALRHLERFGIYNVAWLTFRRGPTAVACLRWWRERCLTACADRPEGGQFADQKYLDDWPERFGDVAVIQHPGANLAPWNVANHSLAPGPDAVVLVDGRPLIFYHFHGLATISRRIVDPHLRRYRARLTGELRRFLYIPYLRALANAAERAAGGGAPSAPLAGIRGARAPEGVGARLLGLARSFRQLARSWFGVVTGRCLKTPAREAGRSAASRRAAVGRERD
jgi:hypothetical protein